MRLHIAKLQTDITEISCFIRVQQVKMLMLLLVVADLIDVNCMHRQ